MKETQWLENQLNNFARRFYFNRFLQRLAIFVLCVFGSVFLASFAEYRFWFASDVRKIVFFILLGVIFLFFILFLFSPLLEFLGFKRSLNKRDFALIIGKHFPDINDQILNVIELDNEDDLSFSKDLVIASIRQKSEKIKIKNFNLAIDTKKTLKYLPFLILPLLLFIVMSFSIPEIIIKPLSRIGNYSQNYIKPAPFDFVILNKSLTASQNSDFELQVKLKGNDVPDELFININSSSKMMYKNENNVFVYSFKNIKSDQTFNLIADGYSSKNFIISVFKKPVIVQYNLKCEYPVYTGKKTEVLSNVNQITVPRGTNIYFSVMTRDADSLKVFSADEKINVISDKRYWGFKKIFFSSSEFDMFAYNSFFSVSDSLNFRIDVVDDEYPHIIVEESIDSVYILSRFFKGRIFDDYGLTKLQFSYVLHSGKNVYDSTLTLNIDGRYSEQEFFNSFDFSLLQLQPGDKLEYFFKVFDNDAVNGPKSAKSQTFVFNMPTQEEMEEMLSDMNSKFDDELNKLYRDASNLNKEMEKLLKDINNKKNLSWDDKERVNKLLEKEKNIENRLNDLNKENQTKMQLEQNSNLFNREIFEKQQKINELMNDIMSDELKDLIKQLEELMNMSDKNIKDKMNQVQKSNEDLLQNMDRSIELFKHIKAEKELEKIIDKLENLGSKEIAESKKIDENGRKEAQQKINEDFEKLKQNVDSLMSYNKDLEEPYKLEDIDEKMESIDSTMQEAEKQIDGGKMQKGAKSQKSAGEQMQELSQELQKMMDETEKENLAEDINVIRKILDNLVRTSFNQEDVMKLLMKTRFSDPKYLDIVRRQKGINDNFLVIKDSLVSLAKRQTSVSNIIGEELNNILYHGNNVMNFLNNRNSSMAAGEQQYSLMSVNNLALLLADAFKSMQNDMNMQMQNDGKSQCNKGGNSKHGKGKKPSAKTMRQLQEQLNQQMESLQKQMQSGSSKTKSMSEQMAKMAAEQEIIRKALQEYQQELNSEGVGQGNALNKLINDMEKTEEDIVNKRLTTQTINRQKEILTRLLESEKAEMEREKDEQRKSEESKFINNGDYLQNFKYNGLKKSNNSEMLKTISPNMKPFYKQKVSEYLYKLK